MKKLQLALLVTSVSGLCACASLPTTPPDWVATPTADMGFAATSCVPDSGNFSLDRQVAVAKARADIASQIEVKVKAMDKTYAQITQNANNKPASKTSFESVSQQLTDQSLQGSKVIRAEYLKLNAANNLCAEVLLDGEHTKELYSQIVETQGDESGQRVDVATSQVLYRDFAGVK